MNMNLLAETIHALTASGKTVADVEWVGTPRFRFTWTDFAEIADREYDNGHGDVEVNQELMVVGKRFWLERNEYDGAEWWEYKAHPRKPRTLVMPSQSLVFGDSDDSDEDAEDWDSTPKGMAGFGPDEIV
jgi:hypothetical protein